MEAVNLFAPGRLDLADSYGLLSAMLARHLTRSGLYVNVEAFGGAAHPSQPADMAKIVRQPYRKAEGGIFIGYPTNYAKHGIAFAERPRLALTMFESSRIPPAWTPILNTMDGVIVPSAFCAQTFRASGVEVPIHVIPLGIGEIYRYGERPPDRPLTFLSFVDRGPRKGGMMAMQAFLMAFGASMDVHFIWKARTPKLYVTMTNPNMEVIQRDFTEEELYLLYLRADVLINPNKGEGFGLLPREFAATGGIALATGWGGTADHINAWGWPLPYTLEPADWSWHKTLKGLDLGEWAKLDAGAIAKILKDVAAHRQCYLAEAKVKATAAAGYTWQRFALGVRSIWEEVCDAKRHRLRTPA